MAVDRIATAPCTPHGWFSMPEVDDEVLIAFMHGAGFEPVCPEVLDSRLHQGAGVLGGQRAFILIRPNTRHRIGGRPKWGDVVLKAMPDEAEITPIERAWLSGLGEPAPAALGPHGPASLKWGDIVLIRGAGPLSLEVSDAGGQSGDYVLTTVQHVGSSPDGLARLLAGEGLARRR